MSITIKTKITNVKTELIIVAIQHKIEIVLALITLLD